MRRPLVTSLLVAAVAAASPLSAQVNYDTVRVRTMPLGSGVHVLFGVGGNIGLSVGKDAVFVVDDQFAPLTPKILAAIRTLTDKPVKFVLNTHWHGDHTGGNENLGQAGALIVAQDNVRKRMSTEQFMAAMNMKVAASPSIALPVVTFNEEVTFHLNGDSIVVDHVAPAHTDGDAIVHFVKANVIHTGDVFNNTGFPLHRSVERRLGERDHQCGRSHLLSCRRQHEDHSRARRDRRSHQGSAVARCRGRGS